MKHLTYAELGEKIAKKIGKFEIDLKSTEPDVRNTAKRNIPKLKQAMESLKQSNEQEKIIAEATETRNMLAKGGYMNSYAGGGYLPMGEGGLDIGGIGDIIANATDSNVGTGTGTDSWWMGQGVDGANINGGGEGVDWMSLLKKGMGALSGLKKNKMLNKKVGPTEKYNPVYNLAEQAALQNLDQMQSQANEGYAKSQQDIHKDTKGQRMENERNRLRGQDIANVGGPEGFMMQAQINNAAKDSAMKIDSDARDQETAWNSNKAARGAQFTNMLASIADKKMNYGDKRVFQDQLGQDFNRRDWAAARAANNQTDSNWLGNLQNEELMANQQGVDAGTIQSIMDIFNNQSAKNAVGGGGEEENP
jgi:hypothetical protein